MSRDREKAVDADKVFAARRPGPEPSPARPGSPPPAPYTPPTQRATTVPRPWVARSALSPRRRPPLGLGLPVARASPGVLRAGPLTGDVATSPAQGTAETAAEFGGGGSSGVTAAESRDPARGPPNRTPAVPALAPRLHPLVVPPRAASPALSVSPSL